ncbi:hypothetical protein SAMN04487848_3226 [Microbacterium sp. ru370.1]|uniref:hypothetical protein n=1 Tax=unclassified Microbacterium TaxID=2609290 RepID=UPI00087E6A51|nr:MULTISPECIES: hypothetical protein [unclassified Microbacterium]PTT19613.1 hypothetical protein DBR36_07335 [Microbacterium sp. HMWF026]SDP08843.1 hypothetical protein SAMN04487848_3226 [Microbacterium sp. ru370.1]SIT93565.1 hypothetical protein SAMN05880579_3116 [Microbacterium sp. RU1D]
MDEEDVIGNEFDRVLRAAAMGAGQAAEGLRRRAQARDEAARADVMQKQRDQASLTATIYERVQRDEFWRNANGERVANAATYGATLYNHDPKAREIYEIVRERTNNQFGLNVDELRAAHPENEEARRNALLNAVDDRLAALRADAQAADDRSEAARERDDEEQANDEQRQSDADLARERAEAADERAEEREDAAAFHRGEARGHQAEARGLDNDSGREKGLSAQQLEVKEAVDRSFPEPAGESVARGLRRGSPRARTARGGSASREQVQEISR